MSARSPIVSIHAVRRFAERVLGVKGLSLEDPIAMGELRSVYGIDTVEMERELAKMVEIGVAAGAGAVLVHGLRFVLHEGVLVTVIPKPKKSRRKRRIDRGDD